VLTVAGIDDFVEEVRRDITRFQAAWHAKHKENPEHYPLELPADNEGLWFEFFMDFMTSGSETL
jgi:hypothetical protein